MGKRSHPSKGKGEERSREESDDEMCFEEEEAEKEEKEERESKDRPRERWRGMVKAGKEKGEGERERVLSHAFHLDRVALVVDWVDGVCISLPSSLSSFNSDSTCLSLFPSLPSPPSLTLSHQTTLLAPTPPSTWRCPRARATHTSPFLSLSPLPPLFCLPSVRMCRFFCGLLKEKRLRKRKKEESE